MWYARTGNVECTIDICVHDGVPILIGDLSKRSGCRIYARTVEDVIKPLVLSYCLCDQGITLGGGRDVTARCEMSAIWGLGLRSFFVSSVLVRLMSERERIPPNEASLIAVARPMPLPAPGTRITWLLKSGILASGEVMSILWREGEVS